MHIKEAAPQYWGQMDELKKELWKVLAKELTLPKLATQESPMEILRRHKLQVSPALFKEVPSMIKEYVDYSVYIHGASHIRQEIETLEEEQVSFSVREARRLRRSGAIIIKHIDDVKGDTPMIRALKEGAEADHIPLELPAVNFLRGPGFGREEKELCIYDAVVSTLFPDGTYGKRTPEEVANATPSICKTLQQEGIVIRPFQVEKYFKNLCEYTEFVTLPDAAQLKKSKRPGIYKLMYGMGLRTPSALIQFCDELKQMEATPMQNVTKTPDAMIPAATLLSSVFASVEEELQTLTQKLDDALKEKHQVETLLQAQKQQHAKEVEGMKREIAALREELVAAEELLDEASEERSKRPTTLVLEVDEKIMKQFRVLAPTLMGLLESD